MSDQPTNAGPPDGGRGTDAAFAEMLLRRLGRGPSGGPALSAGAAVALEAACPEIEAREGLRRRLDGVAARAARDLRWEEELAARRQRPTLGGYLSFLRAQAGLGISEAAARFGTGFQLLADLERDGLRPPEIPAAKLATLLRRLRASLEQAEVLLAGTVRAPRLVAAPTPGRLFRAAPGASRAEAEIASRIARGEEIEWVENPEYREEVEAAGQLVRELRRRLEV